ncbi:MAG TPA: sulfite reductase, partial [Rhabdochlamydiaceae bacterium]|nr:sulfite reductase [Rhabdochlamydiaceae bacterium]
KLLDKGAEIWSWLQEGAHFYVCGEADPMAKDVEAALKQIFQSHGHLSESESYQFLKQLRKDKRYVADVY